MPGSARWPAKALIRSGPGVSFDLSLVLNVERLILGGTKATDGRGSALEDVLIGKGQGNHLYGQAGNGWIVSGVLIRRGMATAMTRGPAPSAISPAVWTGSAFRGSVLTL